MGAGKEEKKKNISIAAAHPRNINIASAHPRTDHAECTLIKIDKMINSNICILYVPKLPKLLQ